METSTFRNRSLIYTGVLAVTVTIIVAAFVNFFRQFPNLKRETFLVRTNESSLEEMKSILSSQEGHDPDDYEHWQHICLTGSSFDTPYRDPNSSDLWIDTETGHVGTHGKPVSREAVANLYKFLSKSPDEGKRKVLLTSTPCMSVVHFRKLRNRPHTYVLRMHQLPNRKSMRNYDDSSLLQNSATMNSEGTM